MTTATLDLPERWLSTVLAILSAQLPSAEVWAYGSRVRGTAFPASDLDLVVQVPGGRHQSVPLGAVRRAFSDSNLPIHVDICDWARIPADFQAEIARAYVVVQPAPGDRPTPHPPAAE